MSINIRLLSYVLLLSAPVAAQTISPAPAADDRTVTIVTTPAAAGDTIALFSSTSAAGCTGAATPLPLAPNTGNTVLAQAQTAVTPKQPLVAGAFICAVTTSPDKKTMHTSAAVVVLPAAPLPDAVKPIVPAGQGTSLPVVSTVNDSIRIDAVLIPAVISRRIFGNEIAKNYAAVQIIIANHNQDAAFILETSVMDYSHWLFSNKFQLPGSTDTKCPVTSVKTAAINTCGQIASEEGRTVRSEAEDAQVWSARNTVIRIATLAGTVATSYVFLAQNTDYTTGVANYTGQVVPALNAFYPDRSQAQINNISDFGFKTPKVIPKASSDIVVAFFPLANFFTPGLRKLFVSSPAVFNVPGEMLLDAKLRPTLAGMVEGAGVVDTSALKGLKGKDKVDAALGQVSAALGHYERYRAQLEADPNLTKEEGLAVPSAADLTILSVLQKASLDNINILVDGITTVDVNAVPAIIKGVSITDDKKTTTWANGATVKGTISGSYLSGGTITLAKAVTGVPSTITVDPKSTSDTLNFSFTLTAAIPQGTELDFAVAKTASDKSSNVSPPFAYTVPTVTTVTKVSIDDDTKGTTWANGATVTGTITGTGLTGGSVSLSTPVPGIPVTITVDTATSTATSLNFSFKLTGTIAPGTKIAFVVSEKADDGTTSKTNAPDYTVPTPAPAAAAAKAPVAAAAGKSGAAKAAKVAKSAATAKVS